MNKKLILLNKTNSHHADFTPVKSLSNLKKLQKLISMIGPTENRTQDLIIHIICWATEVIKTMSY